MKFGTSLTLRQLLTLPYVALILLTAAVIGLLSYRAGSEAVDSLSDLVLAEMVGRISQAVDRHISGSEAVLETAIPADLPAPGSIEDDIDQLRERLWLATTIHRDPNNYAYYGNRLGQFIGLWRYSETEAELRLRTEPSGPRTIYRISTIGGELRDPEPETSVFDPRERPWFEAGQRVDRQTWTSIYIDFKTLELVGTRARRVDGADGAFEGVVATDMSLRHLDDFLATLALTENGVAFLVEQDGNLLAASRGPHLDKGVGEDNRRINAAQSPDPLIAATYKAVRGFISEGNTSTGTRAFEGPDGNTIQAGFARMQDTAGLDWIVAVATPRSDYLQAVMDNVNRTVLLALIACALIALVGYLILNHVAVFLRQLADAARSMADGDLQVSVPTERNDEIGELARSFAQLQSRTLTDRLTGIPNRDAMLRRLEDRMIHARRARDRNPFALLFVDLDRFKVINDRFGHDVGDRVLEEVSRRLAGAIRDRDLAARFGGDEFVIFLNDVGSRPEVLRIAEKLQTRLKEPYETLAAFGVESAEYPAGASVGIALFPEDGRDIATLLRCADESMYTRKRDARRRSTESEH